MRRLRIEEEMQRFLKFEDPAYALHAQRIMLERYADPDEAMAYYSSWLHVSQRLRDSGTQVFVFDPDAQREIECTDGALTPEEVYDAFPYDAAYVMVRHPIIEGFAVVRDHQSHEMSFMFMEREDWIAEHADGNVAEVRLAEIEPDKLCNLVSYIAAKNADLNLAYTPPSDGASGRKSRKRSAAHVTHVGYAIGAELREYARHAGSSERNGGTVRPHMRRAHWHRFWTGPHGGERKLELRWLQPIWVNPGKGEAVPTVHKAVV